MWFLMDFSKYSNIEGGRPYQNQQFNTVKISSLKQKIAMREQDTYFTSSL